MKNIIKKYVYVSLALLLFSCDSYIDINTNPNYPGNADVDMLLPSGQIALAGIVGGDMELIGGLWSQHYTQNASANQYNTTVNYTISNASYARMWTIPYTLALPDLNLVIKKADAANYANYSLVADVMTCFGFHMLASWYENIPYSEALLGAENLYPEYDEGRVINTALIARLDAAIAKRTAAESSTKKIQSQDLVFGGDLDKWVAFAKTLKLKLLMRDFATNRTAIQSALSAGGFLTVDAKIDQFSDSENNSNPLYENDRRKLNTQNNIAASATLVNYLLANSDPRISVFFEKNQDGEYFGLNCGDRPATGEVPAGKISRAMLAPVDPVYFTSVAESFFLQAEAYARLGDAVAAKTAYNNGVTAAFSRWDLNASTFIATGGVYEFNSTSTDSMLKCILTQKWVAATRCQAWDSFFDINRMGIPALGSKLPTEEGYVLGELSPVIESSLPANEFPKRMIFPKLSADNNPNAPEPIAISVKQWWHK
ncbi:MAG: SusD/RagB family nutrient-binding outer membrane lipoprotein [Clostridia bacterium]|nr:SusD/RagB family nutrient-binding outer membrane lipoprotein [Clostridia bacterium]